MENVSPGSVHHIHDVISFQFIFATAPKEGEEIAG